MLFACSKPSRGLSVTNFEFKLIACNARTFPACISLVVAYMIMLCNIASSACQHLFPFDPMCTRWWPVMKEFYTQLQVFNTSVTRLFRDRHHLAKVTFL